MRLILTGARRNHFPEFLPHPASGPGQKALIQPHLVWRGVCQLAELALCLLPADVLDAFLAMSGGFLHMHFVALLDHHASAIAVMVARRRFPVWIDHP